MNESDKDYENFVERMGTLDINLDALEDHLAHHGILGMKWGVRRYQPYTGGKKGTFLDKKKNQYSTSAEQNKNKSKTKKSSVEKLTGDEKRQIKKRKNEILNQTIEIESKVSKSIKPKNRKDITEVVTLSNEYINNNPKILPKGVNMKYDKKEVDADDGAIHPIVTYNGKVVNFQAFSTSTSDRFLLEEPNEKKDDKINHGDMDVDEYLEHHGILGMKWGIRRYQPYTGGKKGTFLDKKKKQYATSAERDKEYQAKKKQAKAAIGSSVKKGATAYKDGMGKKQARKVEDTKKQAAAIKKILTSKDKNPTENMSDTELRAKINRLQMEKQYSQLTKKDKSQGVKIASSVLSKIGNKVVDRVIDRTIVEPIDKFIKGKM